MRLSRLASLLFAATFAFAPGAVADSHNPQPETPPQPGDPANPSGMPWRDAEVAASPLAAEQALDATPVDYMSGSLVAFQSFRDGNWEVYLTIGAFTVGEHRLTAHPAADIHPRVRRGGGAVLFASNRNGNYDLFVIGTDGQNLRQLTSDPADDVSPAWSRDGTQIVFQAYRDGQPEIYRMNADGSGQTRLTFSPEYDGAPAWSPVGSQIAWTAYRNGGYRIWKMNADGSAPQQVSQQAYSNNPAWSPDGSQILYDSDGDADGWQELWIMNSNATGHHEAWDPHGDSASSEADLLARSWSPNGCTIAFSDLIYTPNNGQWDLLESETEARPAHINCPNPIGLLSSRRVDMHPDWQAEDLVSPVSGLRALPPFTLGGFVPLSWFGQDVGTSKIATFHVQVRDASVEEWSDAFISDGGYASLVPCVSGQTYEFRLRSLDYAGNVEPWPTEAEASTTCYPHRLSARIADTRNVPVAGAVVNLSPQPLGTADDPRQGTFEAYLMSGPDLEPFRPEQPGYGTLPLTDVIYWGADTRMDFWLPPKNNLALDGDFEVDSLGPEWVLGGMVTEGPVPSGLTSEYAHTGVRSFALGKPSGQEVELPEPSTLSRSFTIPADLHAPTLAFITKFLSATDQRKGTFDVLVEDGVSTTNLASLAPTYEWQHVWFDLQPWAGQTVTVTLQVSGTVADWQAWAIVDEYVLGSWDTPQIEGLTPAYVPDPDTLPLTVTLTGENFMATPTVQVGDLTLQDVLWVNANTLEIGVPAGLSVGTYDLWVVNPGGAAAAWPGALKIGNFVYLATVADSP